MTPATGTALVVLARDEQDVEPVDVDRWKGLALEVLTAEAAEGELSLLFVSEGAMAELNAEHMGAEGSTDVLAFPIDGPAAGPGDLLGDVVVCPAVARRNAADHGAAYEDEIALLVVHGVLHVLGHDHADPDEAEVMQGRERHHLARVRP